ncbi:bud site selection protein, partial [Coemansia erecta]
MEEEYKSTAKPNVAVDDEDASGDLHDEDDHVPLSVLSQRNSAVKLSTNPDNSGDANPSAAGVLSDKAPVESASVDNDNSNVVSNGGVVDMEVDAQARKHESENEPNPPSATANEDGAVEQEQPSVDQKTEQADKEEETPVAEKEPEIQPKGKKKNKKNKKGKSKDAPANSTAIPNGEAENASKPEVDSKDDESHGRPANGEAKESTISALGSQMEEVSLDDNKDEAPAADAAADAPVPDAKPVETLTSPRNAVFDIKPAIAEMTPGPNHQSSQQDETKTIEDEPQDGSSTGSEDPTYIRKRLCERWLDNHIMILYEDLRTYTAWRYRMDNLRNTGQPVMYQYTQAEWEALGEL